MLINPDQLAFTAPEAFKQHLLENYETDQIWVVDIYNLLVPEAVKNPEKIAKLADVAVEVFASLSETDSELLFLELHARCLMGSNDLDQVIVIIKRIISLDIVHAESVALELAVELVDNADAFGISLDQRPSVLKIAEYVFHHYGKTELIFDLYIQSAYIYSAHGASQAAYRCIVNAEEIADDLVSIHLKANCYKLYNVVATEETDFKWAIFLGEQALTLYQQAELETPADLLSNIGVAHLNLNELSKAINYFDSALRCSGNTTEFIASINLNLSICYRRNDQLSLAKATHANAVTDLTDSSNPEYALELTLGAARIAAERADSQLLSEHLKIASAQLDLILAHVLRLHHRRGIRERYITRIEALLRLLPASGPSSDALLPIVSTHENAMADWLEILSWAESIKREPSFNSELADQLETILHRISQIGAPHLYGFREKYDDPWGVTNIASVWDDLSQLCNRIGVIGLTKPLPLEYCQNHAELCRARLSQGHCLMFTTYADNDALLWCFIGERYLRVALPLEPLFQWHKAQIDYASGEINRPTFVTAIKTLTEAMSSILDPVFEEVARSKCMTIRYIDDALRDIPLMLFVLRNSVLSDRMIHGSFEVRLVPAMVESLKDDEHLSAITSIVDSSDSLLLAPYEAGIFASVIGVKALSTKSAGSSESLTSLVGDADVLIVSTHGQLLTFFTDAFFAKLGDFDKHHVINVPSLQEHAPHLPLRLVILNSCYSGSKISRNYYKRFRTNDSVAIPNLFLLNRKAIALAGAWKLSDTASYVLTYLIGDGIRNGYKFTAAISSAIARLPTITRSDVIAILGENLPKPIFDKSLTNLVNAPEDGLFSNSYFTAGLIVHGLL